MGLQVYSLIEGQDKIIGVGGRSLRVVNHPAAQYTAPGPASGILKGQIILVGFGITPGPSNYDALIPPFSEAVINVPENTPNVHLLVLSHVTTPGSTWATTPVRTSDQLPVGVEWLPIAVKGSLRPLNISGPLPVEQAGELVIPTDGWGSFFPPVPPEHVYDQALGTPVAPHMRPRLGPSMTGVLHQATAANTVFAFTEAHDGYPLASNIAKVIVVKRIWLSVNAATLVVIGLQGLTVGSPGVGEIWRGSFPAAGIQVIDFDEGVEFNVNQGNGGNVGAWQAYTSAAVTLDATILFA